MFSCNSTLVGLRRKPLRQFLQQPFDVSSDYLAQLMEENARRRLQQTFEQQLERIHMQMNRQRQRDERLEHFNQRLQMLAAENAEESNEDSGEAEMESTEVDENAYDVTQNQDNAYRINNNGNRNQYVDFFNYKYDTPMEMNLRERIPFAVGPDDPRFFEQNSGETENARNSDELDSRALDDYQEFVPAESQNIGAKAAAIAAANAAPTGTTNLEASTGAPTDVKSPVLAPAPVESTKLSDGGTTTFHRIKPQNAAAAAAVMKLPAAQDASDDGNARNHISALIDKLQKEGKHDVAAAMSGNGIGGGDNLVLRQRLGVDGEMGMYLVALIAGVSAAVTVGLIALGIAWYT